MNSEKIIVRILFDLMVCFCLLPVPGPAQPDPVELCSHSKSRQAGNIEIYRDEPHPLQEDYSVVYYDLNIKIDPDSKTISGVSGIDAQIIADSTKQIVVDLTSNFQITGITSSGENLGFSRSADLIFIQLSRFYKSGEIVKIRISYQGSPATSAFNFSTRAGKPLIWTLSQPFGAKSWWPCKNYPEDKADSARIAVTVPKGLLVGSNGTLTEQHESDHFTEFVWKVSYPIASYLISIAAHDYLIHRDQYYYGTADSMEVVHYIYRDHFESERSKYSITTEMLTVFASLFGEYPFIDEKYGHAECPFNGGMEHQTLTSLLGPYEYLIAHELAHQWWGDMITCKDYHHIWLNEGFATYSEALWAEYKYGGQAYHENMKAKQYFGEGTIYVPDLTLSGRIFDAGLSYRKGAWVLHMLRHVVGTDHFFNILKTYGDGPKKYGVATTANFRDVCEEVSGMDLSAFFNQWIFGEGYPKYAFDWSYTEEAGKYMILMDIYQLQSGQIFSMPLDVHITTTSGEIPIVLQNNETFQRYTIEVSEKPLAIELDKHNWVLKELVQNRTFVNHNNGNMVFSVFGNGALGFEEPNGLGNGLVYPKNGDNLLYSGSFILGNGQDYVVDNDIVTGESDFALKQDAFSSFQNSTDQQISKWFFDDRNHPESSSLEIEQTARTFGTPPTDEFVLLEYHVKNKGSNVLESLYGGVVLDFDIVYHLKNQVGKDLSRRLIYQKNGIYAGITALATETDNIMSAIADPQQKFAESSKFSYLSGSKDDFVALRNDDWAILNAIGPARLESGDSLKFAFALVAGSSEADLVQKAQLAGQLYDQIALSEQSSPSQKIPVLNILPNPAENSLSIGFTLKFPDDISLYLQDLSGKILFEKGEIALSSGDHQRELDISELEPGVYIVVLRTGYEKQIGRFIKM